MSGLVKQLEKALNCNENAFFYCALQYGSFVEVLETSNLRERIGDAVIKMNEKYLK